jgi:hypothetical protein
MKALGFVPSLFHKASELCHVNDDDEDHRYWPALRSSRSI